MSRPANAEPLHNRTDLETISDTIISTFAINNSSPTIGLAIIKKDESMHAWLHSSNSLKNFGDGRPTSDHTMMSNSGIEGNVTIGPIFPVARPGMVNERPHQATITVLNQQGQTVTQFQSDIEGHFRVILEPGTYTLRPESPKYPPYGTEQTVTVTDKNFTQVHIYYDSGIR
jgi:hypothetical protein